MQLRFAWRAAVAACCLLPVSAIAVDAEDADISEITITAKRVAIMRPAGSYESAVTALRYDPLTELQSRGIAEGQSDVTVRGSLFENTGFQLGAVTVVDPQTGHYTAELPVDPSLLTTPAIYLGLDGAVRGFNSAVATVSYGLRRIEDGGGVTLGAGSDGLNFQSLQFSRTGADLGAAISFARSNGDGTLPNGDHRFSRYNLHLQRNKANSQGNLLFSYQDKFYGWPGAYTGFASLPETDDTQTTLLLGNLRHDTSSGWIEIGGYYRRLVDDYDFDRTTAESGAPGSFDHETRVFALGFQGLHRTGALAWRYGGQVAADELVKSTDLNNGLFNSRSYATFSIVPEWDVRLARERVMTFRVGATIDHSNRDDTEALPLAGISIRHPNGIAVGLEYAKTSQLPGYTALNSSPTGLFGGNPLLGRETAQQLQVSLSADRNDWQGRVTLFQRRDEELVDWTYASGAPFSRQANPVDLDVIGFEAFATRQWPAVDLAAGYTWLDKDSDYGGALVDASYYALNFARHRMTLAITWRFAQRFELRLDNEYRVQEDNPLRTSADNTWLGSVALTWQADDSGGVGLALTIDNVGDSDYQPFPGTPASGRQASFSANYTW
jgi:hypothetical protein